jgi:hypothetical protein
MLRSDSVTGQCGRRGWRSALELQPLEAIEDHCDQEQRQSVPVLALRPIAMPDAVNAISHFGARNVDGDGGVAAEFGRQVTFDRLAAKARQAPVALISRIASIAASISESRL